MTKTPRRRAPRALRTIRAELDALRTLRPTPRGEFVLYALGGLLGAAVLLLAMTLFILIAG
ncbi:hypothetical protein SEA_BOLT007_36 [Arthrobacter phage Bolt007]|uniref:Uncharacterized protein n=1 Tax=Arthrobacter phage Bolt007 TaxID=3017297 RepID=A0AA49E614_9CAUD|nr:hypothetical protein SEA_BOLT007_36 [Arthrobacter phage Bolt007]